MARTKYADKLAELELRVTKLEQAVVELTARVDAQTTNKQDWWNKPQTPMTAAEIKAHDEMYALGRKYRESLRPKPVKKLVKNPVKQARTVKGI